MEIDRTLPANREEARSRHAPVRTISLVINGDRTLEADGTFYVNLSDIVSALLADGQGVGTILNDDR